MNHLHTACSKARHASVFVRGKMALGLMRPAEYGSFSCKTMVAIPLSSPWVKALLAVLTALRSFLPRSMAGFKLQCSVMKHERLRRFSLESRILGVRFLVF